MCISRGLIFVFFCYFPIHTSRLSTSHDENDSSLKVSSNWDIFVFFFFVGIMEQNYVVFVA